MTRHHHARPPVIRTRRRSFVAVVMSLVIVGSTVGTLAIGVRRAGARADDRATPSATPNFVRP